MVFIYKMGRDDVTGSEPPAGRDLVNQHFTNTCGSQTRKKISRERRGLAGVQGGRWGGDLGAGGSVVLEGSSAAPKLLPILPNP